jgi:integrase
VVKEFQKLMGEGGVRRIRFHDLRHSAATFALLQGVPMRVVQEILGHSTITVTANTYSHALPELQADAMQRVADLILVAAPASGGGVPAGDPRVAVNLAVKPGASAAS